ADRSGGPADACVIDRHVKRAKAVCSLCDERLIVGRTRDVRAEEDRLRSAGCKAFHALLPTLFVDVGHDNASTGGGELLGNCTAYAAAGTRDDRNLVLQHDIPSLESDTAPPDMKN